VEDIVFLPPKGDSGLNFNSVVYLTGQLLQQEVVIHIPWDFTKHAGNWILLHIPEASAASYNRSFAGDTFDAH
jgi:hypothetical protein